MEAKKPKRGTPRFTKAEKAYLRDLGKRVKNLREGRGLTQNALAVQLGISANTVALIEGGRTATTVLTLRKVAAELGVKIGVLADDDQVEVVEPTTDPEPSPRSPGRGNRS